MRRPATQPSIQGHMMLGNPVSGRTNTNTTVTPLELAYLQSSATLPSGPSFPPSVSSHFLQACANSGADSLPCVHCSQDECVLATLVLRRESSQGFASFVAWRFPWGGNMELESLVHVRHGLPFRSWPQDPTHAQLPLRIRDTPFTRACKAVLANRSDGNGRTINASERAPNNLIWWPRATSAVLHNPCPRRIRLDTSSELRVMHGRELTMFSFGGTGRVRRGPRRPPSRLFATLADSGWPTPGAATIHFHGKCVDNGSGHWRRSPQCVAIKAHERGAGNRSDGKWKKSLCLGREVTQ